MQGSTVKPVRSLEIWEIFSLLFLLCWAASSYFGFITTASLCWVLGVAAEKIMNKVYRKELMEDNTKVMGDKKDSHAEL